MPRYHQFFNLPAGVTPAYMLPLDGLATVPADWATAGIVDARAFRVGDSALVHKPTHVRPNLVRGACGVTAHVVERDGRLAYWADSLTTCPSCIARS